MEAKDWPTDQHNHSIDVDYNIMKTKNILHILLQIKNKGRFERSVLPLELKTGRATFSMEHKGQVGHAKGQGQSNFYEFS